MRACDEAVLAALGAARIGLERQELAPDERAGAVAPARRPRPGDGGQAREREALPEDRGVGDQGPILRPSGRAGWRSAAVKRLGHGEARGPGRRLRGRGRRAEPRLRALVRRELLTLEADPRAPSAGQYGFRPGPHPRGRLQHRWRSATGKSAPRRRALLRELRLRRARRGARRPLPGGPSQRARGSRVGLPWRFMAKRALRAAAERAVALGSHDQAISYFEQAIDVAATMASGPGLSRAGGCVRLSGRTLRGRERNLRAALDAHRGRGDAGGIVRAATLLGRRSRTPGRPGDAAALLERFGRAASPDRTRPLASLDAELARALLFSDEPELAIESPIERSGSPSGSLCRRGRGHPRDEGDVLVEVGRWHEGLSLIEGGGQLAETNGPRLDRGARAHERPLPGSSSATRGARWTSPGAGSRSPGEWACATVFGSLFVNAGTPRDAPATGIGRSASSTRSTSTSWNPPTGPLSCSRS